MYLICGASGLLGRGIRTFFDSHSIAYTGTYNTRPFGGGVKVDFGDYDAVNALFENVKPTVCINAIGIRDIDVCEKDWNTAKRVNADYAGIIATCCARHAVYMIHISTDMVFSENGAASHDSAVNPLQNYGISKLLGECRVKRIFNRKTYTIIRVPVLYSDDYESLDESPITAVGKMVMNRMQMFDVDGIRVWRPVYVPDLCEFIAKIAVADGSASRYAGQTTHYCNSSPGDVYSDYQIAWEIGKILDIPINHIRAVTERSGIAKVPFDVKMIASDSGATTAPTRLSDGLSRCFQRFAYPAITAENAGDFFIMMDLDGTLIDSERLHYTAYVNIFKTAFKKTFMTWEEFEKIGNTGDLTSYFRNCWLTDAEIGGIKQMKIDYLREHAADFLTDYITGMEDLIQMISEYEINHVVVTNTNIETVDIFRRQLPKLHLLRNWIYRSDYDTPKPNPECYRIARERYYRSEKYVLGFENTIKGYEAIRKTVDHVHIITTRDSYNYPYFASKDVRLASDFLQNI